MNNFLERPIVKYCCMLQFILALGVFAAAALLKLPHGNGPDFFFHPLHIIGNILLVLSTWLAFRQKISLPKLLVFIIPYSAGIEFAQKYTTSRTADPMDLAANFLGVFIGIILCMGLERLLRILTKGKGLQHHQ